MSESLDTRSTRQILDLYAYITALHSGDLDTATALLQRAEQNPSLERMILESSLATSLDDDAAAALEEMFARLRDEPSLTQEPGLTTQNSNTDDGPLLRLVLPTNTPKTRANSELSEMDSTELPPAFDPGAALGGSKPRSKKSSRWRTIINTLAAVLLVGILVGSFAVVFTSHKNQAALKPNLPVLVADNVVSSVITVASNQHGTVYALQPADGAELWHYETHMEIDMMVQHDDALYVSGAVAIGHDRLYKFNLKNGAIIWAKDFALNGYLTIAVDDEALALSPGEDNGLAEVLSTKDASLLWRYTPNSIGNGSIWSDPIIALHNHTLYIRFLLRGENGMEAFDLKSGKLLWSTLSLDLGGASPLTFLGQNIYILRADGFGGKHYMLVLDAATGKIQSNVKLPSDEGYVYGSLTDHGLFFTNKFESYKDDYGQLIWRPIQLCARQVQGASLLWCTPQHWFSRFPGDHSFGLANPVIMGHTFYYMLEIEVPGKPVMIWVGALDLQTGKTKWDWTVSNDGLFGKGLRLYLVGTNNTIYLNTQQGLFALDAASGHLRWHIMANKDLTTFAMPSTAEQTFELPS